MILKTLPEASVNGALQSLDNHDPQMTLTYFMARSAEVAYPQISGERLQDHCTPGLVDSLKITHDIHHRKV